MSNPIKNIHSLDTISTSYTCFEKDQVLTEKQLNGIMDYLNDQDRLTRIGLLGVGIIGGLRVKFEGNKVVVGKGAGVTTDGDLPVLLTDTTFDRFKEYDIKAPIYLPFYPEAKETELGQRVPIFELVREGEKDALAKDMSSLQEKSGEMVVVMYMESYQQDHDLCSGADCDNLGLEVTNTVRFLLIPYKQVKTLRNTPATGSALSLKLAEIVADRPLLGKNISSVNTLASVYCVACNNIVVSLSNAFSALHKELPGFVEDLISENLVGEWNNKIGSQFATAFQIDSATKLLISAAPHYLCFYDYLKDLAETWNEMRDVLLDDDSVLCPDINAFPKHILLGRLSNPVEMRTGIYPSPLVGNNNHAREHARFLAWKLHTLINTFEPPKETVVVVTPSSDESVPLENRAIPYYYALKNELPIHQGWNYRLNMRGAANRNLGSRIATFGTSVAVRNQLSYQLGRHNFFRIEGYLGQKINDVTKALTKIIADNNLPIAVRAVLLHNDRKKIIIRPPFRHTPLHDMHYLLRQDVAMQLSDVKTFNLSFKDGIKQAVTDKKIPLDLPFNATTEKTATIAESHYEKVDVAIGKASAPLGAARYSDYRKTITSTETSWKPAYSDTIKNASTFKLNFGDMVRNEFSTPLDSLMTSNHSLWIDWLDNLIDHNDAKEDDKLLFSSFIAAHPALEHFGGVARGGTLVLAYDDNANVVADFMLPYYAAEIVEEEPVAPVLPPPTRKPPVTIHGGFTLLQPLDAKLQDFKELHIKPEWKQEIGLQKEHINFFTSTLQTFNAETIKNIKAGGLGEVGITGQLADDLLKIQIDDVEAKTKQADALRKKLKDVTLTEAAKQQTQAMLVKAEAALGESIATSTGYIVDNKVDLTAIAGGGVALNYLAQSASKMSAGAARDTLGSELGKIKGRATTDAHGAAIGGFIGGFTAK